MNKTTETLMITHIKVRTRPGTTIAIALCGDTDDMASLVSKGMWNRQNARNLIQLINNGEKSKYFAKDYGKSWKFCPDCMEKI